MTEDFEEGKTKMLKFFAETSKEETKELDNELGIEALLRICGDNNKGVCFLRGADWQIQEDLPYTAAIHDRDEPGTVEIMWASSISYEHALGRACEAIGLVPLGSIQFDSKAKWFSQIYDELPWKRVPCEVRSKLKLRFELSPDKECKIN